MELFRPKERSSWIRTWKAKSKRLKLETNELNSTKERIMNNPHVLIDLNEASDVVINFIGTDKFDEIVSALEDNAKAGFIAGMSFALCLANANCKTFLYHIEEQKKNEDK